MYEEDKIWERKYRRGASGSMRMEKMSMSVSVYVCVFLCVEDKSRSNVIKEKKQSRKMCLSLMCDNSNFNFCEMSP